MKKSFELGTLFIFFWISLSTFGFVPLSHGKNVLAGQELYRAHCAPCHGPDAKGSLSMAKSLKADPLQMDLTREKIVQKSNEDLRKLIASGHGKMPKQKGNLTAAQVRSLIQYLRTLQKAFVSR